MAGGMTLNVSTQNESYSSVEIEDRAKGPPKITVKVYVQPGDEDAAAEKAVEIHGQLTKHYAWMEGTSKEPPKKAPFQKVAATRQPPVAEDAPVRGGDPFD